MNTIKQILFDLEADLCGIASVDRFSEAPEGFNPVDTLPSCKSVIIFGKRFLKSVTDFKNTMSYTIVRNMVWLEGILVNIELDADKIINDKCPENCNLCAEICPVKAIKYGSLEIDQKECRIICLKCLVSKNKTCVTANRTVFKKTGIWRGIISPFPVSLPFQVPGVR